MTDHRLNHTMSYRTDDTRAVREALWQGRSLRFTPPRPIYLTEPIVLPQRAYVGVPDGPPVRIIWNGVGSAPFIGQNCRAPRFENVIIEAAMPCEALVILARTIPKGPGVFVPTRASFERVDFMTNGLAPYAVWHMTSAGDDNNEHSHFTECDFISATQAAIRVDGKQSKEHIADLCRVEGCRRAYWGESSILWNGGTISGAEVAFEWFNIGDRSLISFVGVEATQRLLVTPFSTAPMPVALLGVRYAADALHSDGAFIVMRHAGPLTLDAGCQIGGGAVDKLPTIVLTGSGPQLAIIDPASFDGFGASTASADMLGNYPFDHGYPGWNKDGAFTEVATSVYRRGANDDPNCTIR